MKTKSKRLSAIDPTSGFRLYYPNRETTLYYVEFNHKGNKYYKIGITTQTVEKRFAGEPVPYKILWTRKYKSGRTAYIKEQKILEKYMEYRDFSLCVLKSGNTELFTKNIMKGSL